MRYIGRTEVKEDLEYGRALGWGHRGDGFQNCTVKQLLIWPIDVSLPWSLQTLPEFGSRSVMFSGTQYWLGSAQICQPLWTWKLQRKVEKWNLEDIHRGPLYPSLPIHLRARLRVPQISPDLRDCGSALSIYEVFGKPVSFWHPISAMPRDYAGPRPGLNTQEPPWWALGNHRAPLSSPSQRPGHMIASPNLCGIFCELIKKQQAGVLGMFSVRDRMKKPKEPCRGRDQLATLCPHLEEWIEMCANSTHGEDKGSWHLLHDILIRFIYFTFFGCFLVFWFETLHLSIENFVFWSNFFCFSLRNAWISQESQGSATLLGASWTQRFSCQNLLGFHFPFRN